VAKNKKLVTQVKMAFKKAEAAIELAARVPGLVIEEREQDAELVIKIEERMFLPMLESDVRQDVMRHQLWLLSQA
jgi:hypothetical protein